MVLSFLALEFAESPKDISSSVAITEFVSELNISDN
jgi:hypothetical protein